MLARFEANQRKRAGSRAVPTKMITVPYAVVGSSSTEEGR